VSISPLRYGAGVKGKINTAMSYGMPVVATTPSIEGMHLTDGEDVLVADAPEAFAAAVARLHEDRALWERLSRGGLANVERHFSRAVAREAIAGLLALERR
jgi:glycosyltransferase involved in cell wall biosynthesis